MDSLQLERVHRADPVVGAADGEADREFVNVLQGHVRIDVFKLRSKLQNAVGGHLVAAVVLVERLVRALADGLPDLFVFLEAAAGGTEHLNQVFLGQLQHQLRGALIRAGQDLDGVFRLVGGNVLQACEAQEPGHSFVGRNRDGNGVIQKRHGAVVHAVPEIGANRRILLVGNVASVLLQEGHVAYRCQRNQEGPLDGLDRVDPDPVAVVAFRAALIRQAEIFQRRGPVLRSGVKVHGRVSKGLGAVIRGIVIGRIVVCRLGVIVCHPNRKIRMMVIMIGCGPPGHTGAGDPDGVRILRQLPGDVQIRKPIIVENTGIILPVHLPVAAAVLVMAGEAAAAAARVSRICKVDGVEGLHARQTLDLLRGSQGRCRFCCRLRRSGAGEDHGGVSLRNGAASPLAQCQSNVGLAVKGGGGNRDLQRHIADAKGEDDLPVDLGIVAAGLGGTAHGLDTGGNNAVQGALAVQRHSDHAVLDLGIGLRAEADDREHGLLVVRDGKGAARRRAVGGGTLSLGQNQKEHAVAVALVVVLHGDFQELFGLAGGIGQHHACAGDDLGHHVGDVLDLLEHVLGGGDALAAALHAGVEVSCLLHRVKRVGVKIDAAALGQIVQRLQHAGLRSGHTVFVLRKDGLGVFLVLELGQLKALPCDQIHQRAVVLRHHDLRRAVRHADSVVFAVLRRHVRDLDQHGAFRLRTAASADTQQVGFICAFAQGRRGAGEIEQIVCENVLTDLHLRQRHLHCLRLYLRHRRGLKKQDQRQQQTKRTFEVAVHV